MSTIKSDSSEELLYSFEEEVLWCTKKLESILMEQKLCKKTAKSTLHALKALRSNKTPFVKKRQIMHMTCGDYRRAMKEDVNNLKEVKNSISAMKDIKTGIFVRKTNNENKGGKVQEFYFNFHDHDRNN